MSLLPSDPDILPVFQHEAEVEPVSLEIFWPVAGGYNSRAVAGWLYQPNRWRRIVLNVPPQEKGVVLRIDPCDDAGLLEIARIRIAPIGHPREGITIWPQCQPGEFKFEDLIAVPDPRCLRLASVSGDPQLYLPPLPEDFFGRRLRISVVLRFNPSAELALKELRPLVAQFGYQHVLEDRLKWLEERLRTHAVQAAELERAQAALGRAEEEARQQTTTAGFLRAELSHARKELDWARNEIERLRRDNERRKISNRNAERSFQLRWTLPSFLLNRHQAKMLPQNGYEFQIETPKSWNLSTDSVTIAGWCFSKSEECIQKIRARIGERTFEGRYGRKRFDVQSVFPNYNNSGFCGFDIELEGLQGRFEIVLEVLGDDERWRVLTTIEARMTRSLFGLDRGMRSEAEGRALRNQIMSLSTKEEKLQKKEIAKMTQRPLISILMPVFNTPADYLREAIQSVEAQIYSDWELCIADDCSTNEATRKVLMEATARDPRIMVEWRKENGGIASASNSALRLAKGDVIALMDHDDLIAPVATLRLAQAVMSHAADFIYSDEGHINSAGEFLGAAYRPAFSPSYLRCHPYIVHLVAFSARLIHEIGGFTEGMKISQDYDLILRAVEKAGSIVHIPEVLYLWRQLPSSAGHVLQDEVMKVSSSLLENHLQRCDLPASVGQGLAFNFFSSHRDLHLADQSVAIIIPTKNQGVLLRRCVESLEKTLPPDLKARFVIVNHDSDEPETLELLSEWRGQHTILDYSGSFNYSAINNFAVRHGAGDARFVLFSNNDIEAAQEGWMERLLDAMVDPKVGAVGPLLLYPDNESVQHAGVAIGLCGIAEHLGKLLPIRSPDGTLRPGYEGQLRVTREVSAVTTGFALVRRGAFEAVNGFNEDMQVGYNDTDLCLRLWQAGYRVLYCGETLLIHHESATRGKSFHHDPHPADSRRFQENWGWLIQKGDPFYNPQLRDDSTSWECNVPKPREIKPRFRRYTDPASLFKK